MKRYDDWPKRLDTFFRQRMNQPFEWGAQDCGLFAADAILEMTGEDLAAGLRGRYSTAQEAIDLIAAETAGGGLAELAEMLTERAGLVKVSVLAARRGDLILLDMDGKPALGILSLDGIHATMPGEHGLLNVYPVSETTAAWRV